MTEYRNPLPVAVAVIPVAEGGVVMIHRVSSPPGLAFPGGYMELGETWQESLARELREETAIEVDPSTVRELRVLSAPDGRLLVFGTAPAVPRAALDAFSASDEVSAVIVVDAARDDVVFPLHAEVLAEFLGRG